MTMKDILGLKPFAPAVIQLVESLAKAANAPNSGPEIKSYSDAVYFNYYQLGISLLFVPEGGYKPETGLKMNDLQHDNLILDSIDIYNVPKDKPNNNSQSKTARSELAFTTFAMLPTTLPVLAQTKGKDGKVVERPSCLDIASETSGKDFVRMLGEPNRKGGGTGPSSGSINIWCEWSNDGLMVEFGGPQATGPQAWDNGKDATWKVITLFQPGTKRE